MWGRDRPGSAGTDAFGVRADMTACRRGELDAIGGWFDAELAPDVTMTNAPADPERIARQQVAFPLDAPIPLAPGDRVHVSLVIRPADHLVRWTVDVRDGDRRQTHSTWNGMLLPQEILARTRPQFVPRLTPRGHARQTVLSLCDGARSLAEIEQEVYDRHRDLFASFDLAQTFVAEVVTRYAG